MKMSHRVAWAFVSILAVAIAAPNLLPAGEGAAGGWTALFNGKDLKGWKFHLGKEGAGNDGTFTVKDGILICSGTPAGYMYTEKSYGNYTLQCEFAFKRPEGLKDDSEFRGNSGCLIHVGQKNALGVWPRSIEVQGAYRQLGIILPIPRPQVQAHVRQRLWPKSSSRSASSTSWRSKSRAATWSSRSTAASSRRSATAS